MELLLYFTIDELTTESIEYITNNIINKGNSKNTINAIRVYKMDSNWSEIEVEYKTYDNMYFHKKHSGDIKELLCMWSSIQMKIRNNKLDLIIY